MVALGLTSTGGGGLLLPLHPDIKQNRRQRRETNSSACAECHPSLRGVDVGAVGYTGFLGGGDELGLCRFERPVCGREGASIVPVRRANLIAVQLVDLLDCGEHGVPVGLCGRWCAECL